MIYHEHSSYKPDCIPCNNKFFVVEKFNLKIPITMFIPLAFCRNIKQGVEIKTYFKEKQQTKLDNNRIKKQNNKKTIEQIRKTT